MKLNKINLFSFLLMFINIFLSFPLLIINIYKKKESIFLISLFLAILAFFFIPEDESYDIARYYQVFDDETYRKFFFEIQSGVIIKYLVNLLLYFKLPKNFLAFFSAFVIYYCLFKTFQKNITKKKSSNFLYIGLFMVTYISIPIIGYTGMRSLPATALFVYGVLNNISALFRLILLLISCMLHTSMIVPILLYYFSIYFLKKNVFSKGIIFIAIFLGLLLSAENFKLLLQELKFISISSEYILGKWGINYIETRTTLLSKVINYILLNLRFIVIFYFNIFLSKSILKNNEKENFILLFSCLCFILYRYFIFWERYTNILIFLIYFLVICKDVPQKEIKYKIFKIIIFLYFILSFVYDIRRCYISFYISYINIFKLSFFNIILKVINNYF